ncbi:hypothetical protein EU803_05460 [Loktanella sp. IMCC34160]|uniref:hypothetical protein n=1 Tax=Loktanella sp. IMCC34160 TaxID=2510646 RepID=UPI00101BB727|nr:hypothetical protein [Loktanella sp. IMCC34160]RYG91899.1 hypothetical protein EU803_05460 [Loktanella sp. IMCC34160]
MSTTLKRTYAPPQARHQPVPARLGCGLRPEEVLPALTARFDAEMAERDAKRALRNRHVRRRRWFDIRRLLSALPEKPKTTVPLERRLSTNALNAALLAFSLPIGLAMFVLAALGRESLSMTARTMALTGTAMGTSQLEAGQELLKVLF